MEVINNGMESNDGYAMDQEWKQRFSMTEGIKFATQIDKARRAFEPLPGLTPNLINQSQTETVHNELLCHRTFKDAT